MVGVFGVVVDCGGIFVEGDGHNESLYLRGEEYSMVFILEM